MFASKLSHIKKLEFSKFTRSKSNHLTSYSYHRKMAAIITNDDIKAFNVSNKFGFLNISDSDDEGSSWQKPKKPAKQRKFIIRLAQPGWVDFPFKTLFTRHLVNAFLMSNSKSNLVFYPANSAPKKKPTKPQTPSNASSVVGLNSAPSQNIISHQPGQGLSKNAKRRARKKKQVY